MWKKAIMGITFETNIRYDTLLMFFPANLILNFSVFSIYEVFGYYFIVSILSFFSEAFLPTFGGLTMWRRGGLRKPNISIND